MHSAGVREAIERATTVFTERPSSSRKTNPSATAVLVAGLRCDIAGPDGESTSTDMPKPMGGTGAGPSPGWFFRASIASCTATAIGMRAAVLGIELDRLEVSVHSDSDAQGLLGMGDVSPALSNLRMEVRVSAREAKPHQLEELVSWADAHSPVGCTLRTYPGIQVKTQIL